ncbi:hypothetical protein AgCh_039129 [Apium graveolens]
MGSHGDNWDIEEGEDNVLVKEHRNKSEEERVTNVRFRLLRIFLANLQQMIFGTKLFVLFPAIPSAIMAKSYNIGRPWIFALSLLGLTPLAERISFVTEQISFFTGPTVGGLLNATCGNATELIIALLALRQGKIDVLKYSLYGSVLSNLLLVLGSSLLCGGLADLNKEQIFDKKQTDLNSLLLIFGLLCHVLPLMFKYAKSPASHRVHPLVHGVILRFSRASSIAMLTAYAAYLVFQLRTPHQLVEPQEEAESNEETEEEPVIGIASGLVWLVGMTTTIALLSEYVVGTIEDASDSWGISVSFISIILLPIVGNAAEHAGSVIFALKNKLDISLGVSLGSATQISMFVIPLCVIVGWIMGIPMDLDFGPLQTASLACAILMTTLTLQDGTSHYLKGLVLCLAYVVIAACFFVQKLPSSNHISLTNVEVVHHPQA